MILAKLIIMCTLISVASFASRPIRETPVGPPTPSRSPVTDEVPLISYEYSADGYCASMITCRTLGKDLSDEDIKFLEAFFPKGPGQNLREFASIHPLRACGILTNCQD